LASRRMFAVPPILVINIVAPRDDVVSRCYEKSVCVCKCFERIEE